LWFTGEGRLPKRELRDRLSRGNSFVGEHGRSGSLEGQKKPPNGDSQDIAIWNINDNEHR
jgi:amidophosphoribosyltransferase